MQTQAHWRSPLRPAATFDQCRPHCQQDTPWATEFTDNIPPALALGVVPSGHIGPEDGEPRASRMNR
jgi:hypothetical protein